MARTTTLDRIVAAAEPTVRRIGVADLRDALARGWTDFRASPTQLVFLTLIYPLVGFTAASVAGGRALMPLVWPLVSGFALVGPLAALGVYELSRRRERGLDAGWTHAFDVLRSPAMGAIAALALLLLAIFVAWVATARAIYDVTLGGAMPDSLMEFVGLLGTGPGVQLIVLGNAVGALFAAAVLTLTVVAFPLLLDRDVPAAVAMRTSVRAVAANPGPMALWGLTVGTMLFLGSIPFFVGLAVVLPLLGHATWHLYRKVVV